MIWWYIIISLLGLGDALLLIYLWRLRSLTRSFHEIFETEDWIAHIRRVQVEAPSWLPRDSLHD